MSASVSVVIPARDPGPYLHEAVASVLAQTRTDWELVVVDDGSTEDLSWVAEVDERARLVRTAPRGVSTARNRGIAETTAALVAFLDADDRWSPRKLERQLAVMVDDVAFSYTAFDLIDERGERLGPGYGGRVGYLDMLAGRLSILQSTVIARRDALLAAGLYDPLRSLQEDLDLFLRLARGAEGVYVDSVEAGYRQHRANASAAYREAMRALLDLYRAHAAVARRDGDVAALSAIAEGRRRIRKTYGYQAIDAARIARREGRHLDSAIALAHSVQASPAAVVASGRSWLRSRFEVADGHDRSSPRGQERG